MRRNLGAQAIRLLRRDREGLGLAQEHGLPDRLLLKYRNYTRCGWRWDHRNPLRGRAAPVLVRTAASDQGRLTIGLHLLRAQG